MNKHGQVLGDSHCHIGIECNSDDIIRLAEKISEISTKLRFFHIMTTFYKDVELLDLLLDTLPSKSVIVPYYGVHPWYSHLYTFENYENMLDFDIKLNHYNQVLQPHPSNELLDILPIPMNIYKQLELYEKLIEKHDIAYGIGEIGLDKLFKIPKTGFFGNKLIDAQGLTQFKTSLSHQQSIFQCQLQFANDLQKHVSLHCVKTHGKLYEIMINYPKIPKLILHSFSGSIEQARLWCKNYQSRVMFSFSNYINGQKMEDLIKFINHLSNDQILVETDYPVDQYLLKTPDIYWSDLFEIWSKIYKIKLEQILELDIEDNINRSIGV